METNIRLFVAIEIPEEIKIKAVDISTELKEQKLFEGTFVQHDHLHITVQFLGPSIENKLLPDICQALRKIKIPSFPVFLTGLGVNNRKNIRVIWINCHSQELTMLSNSIAQSLENIVELKKEYDFTGHITIARVRTVQNKEELLNYISMLQIQPISFEATEFVLKQSVLTESGPVYTDIERYELTANENW